MQNSVIFRTLPKHAQIIVHGYRELQEWNILQPNIYLQNIETLTDRKYNIKS